MGRAQQEVTAESALRGAWANAWFDGAEAGLPEMRSGAALDNSPIGRVLSGVVAMHAELPSLVAIVGTAPAQALARMHAIVARGFAPDAELGRPRSGEVVDDPLRLGGVASSAEVAERLSDLSQVLVASTAPGILVAAVAHAEIASMRPFGWGSGLVARALPRLLLAQRGVDPGMLGAPEVGLKAAGRPGVRPRGARLRPGVTRRAWPRWSGSWRRRWSSARSSRRPGSRGPEGRGLMAAPLARTHAGPEGPRGGRFPGDLCALRGMGELAREPGAGRVLLGPSACCIPAGQPPCFHCPVLIDRTVGSSPPS